MRKVWYHQIWIQNNLRFIVLILMYSLEHQKCYILLLEPVYWVLLWPVFGSSLSCLVGHYIIGTYSSLSCDKFEYTHTAPPCEAHDNSACFSCKKSHLYYDTFGVPDCMYLNLIWQKQFWLAKFDKILFFNKINGFHIPYARHYNPLLIWNRSWL